MQFPLATIAGFAAAVSAGAIPAHQLKRSGAISITPHDSYGSSIGVLGCKVDTNRIAYWPSFPGCSNMCVKVTSNGRSVHLLKVDQSGGAYDISYDAWNYLSTGKSATKDPTMGGGIDATYKDVDMSECSHLLKDSDGKLAFTAANSMNFYESCTTDSWFMANYAFYNIANAVCTLGFDEKCELTAEDPNNPKCDHQLGLQNPLTVSDPVMNIAYGTGKLVKATQ